MRASEAPFPPTSDNSAEASESGKMNVSLSCIAVHLSAWKMVYLGSILSVNMEFEDPHQRHPDFLSLCTDMIEYVNSNSFFLKKHAYPTTKSYHTKNHFRIVRSHIDHIERTRYYETSYYFLASTTGESMTDYSDYNHQLIEEFRADRSKFEGPGSRALTPAHNNWRQKRPTLHNTDDVHTRWRSPARNRF